MATKHNLKIEVLTPTSIEAEVPRQQKLREPSHTEEPQDDNIQAIQPASIENVSDGKLVIKHDGEVNTYAPVLTVKTVESTFGKDGLKFQRLTVTEDVAVGYQHLFKKETKGGKTVVTQEEPSKQNGLRKLLQPVYVGDSSAPAHQRFWKSQDQDAFIDDTLDPPEDRSLQEDKKAKTRIPVSRFKSAVQKVKERKTSEGSEEPKIKKQPPEKPPRRSSIPKLSDRILAARKSAFKTEMQDRAVTNDDKTPVKTDTDEVSEKNEKKPGKIDRTPVIRRNLNRPKVNIVNNVANEIYTPETPIELARLSFIDKEPLAAETNEQLDDEFDKLYEEIADTGAGSITDEILDTKVKDPERLESKFEEIVHQYDEQVKVEPSDKAKYSKIPLLKRRSEHEIKVPKQSERRLSLKTGIPVTSIPKTKVAQTNDINDEEKITDVAENLNDKIIVTETKDLNDNSENNTPTEPILETDDNNVSSNVGPQSPIPTPPYNIIQTPDAELVKLGLSNFDPISETHLVQGNTNDTKPNEIATPEPETVKVSVLDIPANITQEEPILDFETGEIKEVGYIIEEPISINEPLYIENETVINQPEVVEVSDETPIENQNIVLENDIKDQEGAVNIIPKETVKVATIDFDIPLTENPGPKLIESENAIPNTDDEFKSVKLLRSVNSIEERTKSRYVNRPLRKENEVTNATELEEDIATVTGKVSRIMERLTSHEAKNHLNKNNDMENDEALKKGDVPSKGNVSKIINRMVSQDVDHNVIKVLDDMPVKKSVLSKIAMFERPPPEPSIPRKPKERYSKPKRTISEEIRHSPKIVHEVLKPEIKREQTDKPYEVVTVDVIQPVEVVTNSEEQVLVVEELREEAIVFENLDNTKVETIENQPGSLVTGQNEYSRVDEAATIENESTGALITDETVLSPPGDFKTSDSSIFHEIPPKRFEKESSDIPKEFERNDRAYDSDSTTHWKHRAVLDYIPVKEKINRLTSYEENNIRRAKSTAELDLGDAVKGKVKNMVVRMNSFDLLEENRHKEVISVKERPRKRSVSEKIALFEKKLTPVKMDEAPGRALEVASKPKTESPATPATTPAPTPSDEEYNEKIQELMNARAKYGVANMTSVTLRDGREMPVLALGTALLDPRLAKHIVMAAIDLGFRAIDTAYIYGTEKEVGEGIRTKIQDGTVKREELFIMSKLWSTFHRPDLVEPACRASLNATGLEYFDLLMIHNPMSFKEGSDPLPKIANVLQFSQYEYLDAWFAMEALVGKGLVRSVGLSNFNSSQVARVVDKGRVKPVVNQVECHPYLSQQRLSEFCEARDVRLSCFGALGSPGTPPALRDAKEPALRDPLVQVMAAGLGLSPAQLLLRYQIDSGHSVVVKASSAAHLHDCLGALKVNLTQAHIDALHALNRNKRTFTFKGMGDTHRNYPFKIPF